MKYVQYSLRASVKKLEDVLSSDHFLLQLWIDQKDHETLDLAGFMPFGITFLWSWISSTTKKDQNGNGQQLFSKVSDNISLDYVPTNFAKYFKFTTSGGMIPNWIWRSKELTGPQICEIDMSLQRRHSARPMGSKPMDSTDLTDDIARGMDLCLTKSVKEAIAPKPYVRVYSK